MTLYPEKDVNILSVKNEYGDQPTIDIVGDVLVPPAEPAAQLRLAKQSSVALSPGADIAVLYLRPGTTSGTVKLVVKAGTGPETTVLDNIPQQS